MALKQVKNKIISTQKTGQVTKAMESVSAVKMRKSQEKALEGRSYAFSALRILTHITTSQEGLNHVLAEPKEAEKSLLVVVTSDKGLAGSLNSSVLKQVLQELEENRNVDMVCFGKKAVDFARREKVNVVAEYVNVHDDVKLEDMHTVTELAVDAFAAGTYKKVEIIYQNFQSTFEQVVIKRNVLPLNPTELHHIMHDIRPKKGRYSEQTIDLNVIPTYQIEPNATEVLNTLIPQLVQIIMYHALLENKASEHSARMVAMKNATDKSKEVVKALTIKYNKARQAAITAEVSEITAGVEAMK